MQLDSSDAAADEDASVPTGKKGRKMSLKAVTNWGKSLFPASSPPLPTQQQQQSATQDAANTPAVAQPSAAEVTASAGGAGAAADAENNAATAPPAETTSGKRMSFKAVKNIVTALLPSPSASEKTSKADVAEPESPPAGIRAKPQAVASPVTPPKWGQSLFNRNSTPYEPSATQLQARQELQLQDSADSDGEWEASGDVEQRRRRSQSSDWSADVDENDAILQEMAAEDAITAAAFAAAASEAAVEAEVNAGPSTVADVPDATVTDTEPAIVVAATVTTAAEQDDGVGSAEAPAAASGPVLMDLGGDADPSAPDSDLPAVVEAESKPVDAGAARPDTPPECDVEPVSDQNALHPGTAPTGAEVAAPAQADDGSAPVAVCEPTAEADSAVPAIPDVVPPTAAAALEAPAEGTEVEAEVEPELSEPVTPIDAETSTGSALPSPVPEGSGEGAAAAAKKKAKKKRGGKK
jgi:hypothetical protein